MTAVLVVLLGISLGFNFGFYKVCKELKKIVLDYREKFEPLFVVSCEDGNTNH